MRRVTDSANQRDIVTDHGTISTILSLPDRPTSLMLLAHGAGADMRHRHMQSLAEALSAEQLATLRFNFPFTQAGRRRPDRPNICMDVIDTAIGFATEQTLRLPIVLGGHSYGGRMGAHYLAHQPPYAHSNRITCLVCFSFPLHPAGKPDTSRAAPLIANTVPQFIINGSRDRMADPALLQEVSSRSANIDLHLLDTADHSYAVLARRRDQGDDVYREAAMQASRFVNRVIDMS